MIQERGGWLVASVPSRGWLDTLPGDEREAFTNALSGLYKAAGVDMVWERVVERVGPVLFWYDMIGDGLLVMATAVIRSASLYKLRHRGHGGADGPAAVRHRTVRRCDQRDHVFPPADPLGRLGWHLVPA